MGVAKRGGGSDDWAHKARSTTHNSNIEIVVIAVHCIFLCKKTHSIK